MEATLELPPGRGDSDNAEQADQRPFDSVASALPDRPPVRYRTVAAAMASPTSSRMSPRS
jgi:hypothetical protein